MARKPADPNAPPPTQPATKKRARRKPLGFVIQQGDANGKWSDLVDDTQPLLDGSTTNDPRKFKETRQALDFLQGSQLEGEFRVCQVTAVVAVKQETIKRAVVKSVV